MKSSIVIGSRESKLALIQTDTVYNYIKECYPGVEVSIDKMQTTGDKRQDVTLDAIGGKGLFTKELDQALNAGRIDLAVHSLKDLPMDIPDELPIVALSKREDPRDVLVLPKGVETFDGMGVIGCSSFRRRLQAKRLYPDATFENVRGNVLTRMEKLDAGEFDALILAAAGLKRLGLTDRISRYFSADEILPAAGQGILAVQGKKGQDYSYLDGYADPDMNAVAACERAFVKELDGGCTSPVAAHAYTDGENVYVKGLYYLEESDDYMIGEKKGPKEQAKMIGLSLAKEMRERYGSRAEGKVYLVGAGPGDVGLITMKGNDLLNACDTVVYDHLAGEDILARLSPEKELINVGKHAGSHPVPQEEINRILVEKAKEGKTVVRLKGGDPFLFGRGGEEIAVLKEEGVSYEVVPGVSSALAVPAYNGIPATHRDLTSSVHIITAHRKAGTKSDIPFKALVEVKGTLVFMMGFGSLGEIMKGLMEAGMDKNMPAAVLENGTTAAQRKVIATIETLEAESKKQEMHTPAIIIVGEVVSLSDTLSWYESLPLMGTKILLTRPKELMSETAKKLREKGADVLELPTIETVKIKENTALKKELAALSDYRWIVFTSQVGVRFFFEELNACRLDIRSLSGIKFAVIGKGTEKALKEKGIFADLIPEVYDGENLGMQLASLLNPGDKILIARAKKGNAKLVPLLERAGAIVTDLPLYDTVHKKPNGVAIKDLVQSGAIDIALFTSSSTVEGFIKATEGADYSNITAACIGKQTAKTAKNYGLHVQVSDEATIDSLIALVERIKNGIECNGNE